MENKQTIIELIRNPQLLNRNTVPFLRDMIKQYPYYQSARMLLLQNLYKLHDSGFNKELKESASLIANRKTLFDIVEAVNYEIPSNYEIENSEIKPHGEDLTMDLIESFLRHNPEEKTESRHRVKADPSSDYTAYLEELDDVELDEEEINDDIIPKMDVIAPIDKEIILPEIAEKEDEEDLFPIDEEPSVPTEEYYTETLAAIYVKQKKYDRALEIISHICADNPKKSAYFADQIRFLKKLVLITKEKK